MGAPSRPEPLPEPSKDDFKNDARRLTEQGLKVIAGNGLRRGSCTCSLGPECKSPGKHPWFTEWTTRMRDLDDQCAFIDRRPPGEVNIGVLAGAASGVIVLDVDPRNGGNESLAALEKKHGQLPLTVESRTGGGGKHYYFRVSGRPVPVGSNGKIAPGIDIKGDRGYVVAPPSVSGSGPYTWIHAPWDVPVADAPAWLLAEIDRVSPPKVANDDAPERGHFPPAREEEIEAAREDLRRHGPAIEGQGGDKHTFVACAILLNDHALPVDQAEPLILEWNKTCQPPWEEHELLRKLPGGLKYAQHPRGYKRKPVIQLVAGKLSEITTQAEQALLNAGVQVFSRGGALVRPVVEEVEAAHGRRTKVARLTQVTPTYARDLMSHYATFQRRNVKKDGWVTADPPAEVAQTWVARAGDWKVHAIAGLITTPTMRPDGTILDRPGFDPATRLVLMAPPSMPPIPDAPTRSDAAQALGLYSDLLIEFPFADDASRSVGLSGLITPVVRGAFSVAPAHAATASTPGTGKSFLWDTSAAICIGQPMPVMAAGQTEEESEKRLGAAVITGQPVIALDNVNGGIGGDAFCQIIERPVVDVRILGRSELARVESRSTVFLTGNNLQILGDATRRVLLARLEANMERPELRQFKSNPVEKVLADRGRYVAAALTIVRAYVAAGKLGLAPRLGSFEGWSDTVRGALIWLGCADPAATMETARAEDPLMVLLRATLSSWAAHIGTGRSTARTAAEVLRIAEGLETVEQFRRPETAEPFQALREAVLGVASNRGRPDARTFGKWLARNKGRIVAGLRLQGEADSHGHASKWWVEPHGNCG
ncbi:bifunctional DNA primase/polymerase [Hyalangium gracile]|uniref:bifunctional DNA primase/polymerase n=1 Tax=Hyalangium gracile TaxID=394092 RepID=UPI001CCA9AAB|nr:bifunctional DNA primase/polymerase [Hyalangium gracile]